MEQSAPFAVQVYGKFWRVDADGAEPGIDYPRLLGILRRERYDRWITFEYEAAEAEATGIPRALGYLRHLLSEG